MTAVAYHSSVVYVHISVLVCVKAPVRKAVPEIHQLCYERSQYILFDIEISAALYLQNAFIGKLKQSFKPVNVKIVSDLYRSCAVTFPVFENRHELPRRAVE